MDILEGTSEHAHFAPLSTEQTRAICKHLQAQMDDLQSKIHGLDKERGVTNTLHNNLMHDVAQDRARVDDMQRALDATRLDLAGTNKELQQLRANDQRLRSDLDDTKNKVGQLLDDHKTEQLALRTADGLERTDATLKHVRDMMESKVVPNVDGFREDLSKVESDLNALRQICDQMKADAKSQRDDLRATDAIARDVANNLAKPDSPMEEFKQEANEFKKKLASMQKALEGTRNGLLKLQDNQVRVASAVGDLQGGIKGLNDEARSQKDSIHTAERNLGSNQDQIQAAVVDLRSLKDALARHDTVIGKLKSSVGLLTAKTDQVTEQLEHTDSIARGTRKGLDQTNSVVLPNLALDPHVASSHEFARSVRTPRVAP
jgi:chromosome segregation ATPase